MNRSNIPGTRFKMPLALSVLVVVAVLYLAREVLIPIALAVLLTFLLTPVVHRLERRRLPRVLAVLLVVGLSVIMVAGVGWVVEGQLMDLAGRLPEYKSNIHKKLEAFRPSESGTLGGAQRTIAELGRDIAQSAHPTDTPVTTDGEQPRAAGGPAAVPPGAEETPVPVRVVSPPSSSLSYAKSLLGPLLAPLGTAGIVIVFTVFMLLKREDLRNRLIRLVGHREMHMTTQAMDDAADRVSRYLLMQLIVNASAGLLIGVGLFFVGVPNAGLWGLLAGMLRFVPYVGLWIAATLPIAVSLAVSPGWIRPSLTFGLFVVVEVVCGNVVEPLLYGSKTGVAPLAILAAAVFWTWLWGGAGLLLSTPLTVCLAVIGRHVPQLRFLDVLLGDEPVLTPEARFYQRLLAGDQEEAARIVEAFAKEKSPVEVFDALLLPAMRMAEVDRHRGDLDDARERFIVESLATIIEDVGPGVVSATARPPGSESVLCLPARDHADELSARMLVQLLMAAGVTSKTLTAQAFSGELLAAVAETAPAAVCISALPPGATVHARVLAKRLRSRFPELPIVVGVWDGSADAQTVRERVGTVVTDRVATTLAQAVEMIRPLALAAQATAPTASNTPGHSGDGAATKSTVG